MNRKLLALAVGAALSLPLAAQAAPTVYGKVNASVDYLSGDSYKNVWEINSNVSRFGIKGDESLTSSLSALYQVEMGLELANGDASLSSRNRFVGLKHNDLGTVRLGRFDSAFKATEGAVDVFNDQKYADMENGVGVSGQGRLSRVVGYSSPLIANNITLNFDIQQGNNTSTDASGKHEHSSDGFAASGVYKADNLYLALGLEKGVNDGAANGGTIGDQYIGPASYGTPGLNIVGSDVDARSGIRLVGVVTAGDLQVGGLVQSTQSTNDDIGGPGNNKQDEMAFLVSAAYKMDKSNTLKGELGYNKYDFTGGDAKITFVGAGLDHSFTAATKVYGLLAYQDVKPSGAGAPKDSNFNLGLGIETKF
ncbi:MAG: porin [bacterium]|nr:porin [bacterium]